MQQAWAQARATFTLVLALNALLMITAHVGHVIICFPSIIGMRYNIDECVPYKKADCKWHCL